MNVYCERGHSGVCERHSLTVELRSRVTLLSARNACAVAHRAEREREREREGERERDRDAAGFIFDGPFTTAGIKISPVQQGLRWVLLTPVGTMQPCWII